MMAIFSGDWKDGNGVPFDPSAFQCQDYAASGTAQLRPRSPRRTAAQQQATLNFSIAARLWFNTLDETERQTWRDNGPFYHFFERHGDFSSWYGYRSFMRSQIPGVTAGTVLKLQGPDFGVPWDALFVDATREDGGGLITVYMVNLDRTVEPKSHIEIFQINPAATGLSYEIDWTRLLLSVPGWANGDEAFTFEMSPHWVNPTWMQYKLLIRWWNVHLCGQVVTWTVAA